MLRRLLVVLVAVLALVTSATAALPAAARTNHAVVTHRLVVSVRKTLAPAAEKRLAVLILISQNGGAPAGAVVTASRPLTVLLGNTGVYRVRAEIDSACKASCAASARISGSANHKLEVVPGCQLHGSGFVCRKVRIVKVD
jgi:hypothetical protein